ncbi:MAG TPA: acyl carrier protein [Caldisericia bacterium]|jgi:acyl carrier protein|nr:acyl carrier protein [Caldisericia bacterium]HXK51603.1 acyl carrier protein [Caldisericia bacterium]
MTREEVLQKVVPVISDKLGINEDLVVEEAHFINDLGADSLGLVDITMALEEEFGLEIPDEDAGKLETVGTMIDYIVKAA